MVFGKASGLCPDFDVPRQPMFRQREGSRHCFFTSPNFFPKMTLNYSNIHISVNGSVVERRVHKSKVYGSILIENMVWKYIIDESFIFHSKRLNVEIRKNRKKLRNGSYSMLVAAQRSLPSFAWQYKVIPSGNRTKDLYIISTARYRSAMADLTICNSNFDNYV